MKQPGEKAPGIDRCFRLGSLLFVVPLLAGCAVHRDLVEKEDVDVAVEHLLVAMDRAVQIAHDRHGDSIGLTITEVSLQLKTSVEKDASQNLTLSVLEIEAEQDESFTQTLALTLDPPGKPDGRSSPATDVEDGTEISQRVVDRLAEGIDAAILAAEGAKAGLHRLHPDGLPLKTKKIQVAMAFSLSTTGDGVPTVSILGIDLGAERTRSRVHTVTLTFEVVDDHGESSEGS